MAAIDEEISTSPFGKSKRDWVVLYRIVVTICSLFAAGGIALAVYAGSSYVERAAQSAALSSVEPLQKERNETLKDYLVWRTQKDVMDTRMLTLIEAQTNMALRQQVQLDRQQSLIDQLAQRRP